MADATARRTYVIVHGAWGGAYSHRQVADLLIAKGHDVFRPTLTGQGERSHLRNGTINLSTHVQDILNVIAYEKLSDIVLVGHSYGGMVITMVADRIPELISSIVYLDAFMPENGQSLMSLMPPDRRDQTLAEIGASGGLGFPGAFQQAPGVVPDWRRGPQSAGTFLENAVLTGAYRRIPKKTYVWAEKNAGFAFTRTYERLKGDAAWSVHALPCGHNVQTEMPREVAEILLGA